VQLRLLVRVVAIEPPPLVLMELVITPWRADSMIVSVCDVLGEKLLFILCWLTEG